jgi:hypothetical protein
MKECKIKKVSPRNLIGKPVHIRSKTFINNPGTINKIETVKEAYKYPKRKQVRKTEMSEEIVYEYDEDDVESEAKIKTMIDLNDTTEVTSSSELPSLSSKIQEAMPDQPYLYQMRSRHMYYLHRPSLSTNEQMKSNKGRNGKANKIKKGDILKHIQNKAKRQSMDALTSANHPWIGLSASRPLSKQIIDSTISLSQTESYDLTPESDSSDISFTNMTKHRRTNAIEVCKVSTKVQLRFHRF